MVEPLPHVREIPPYVPGKPPAAQPGLTTYKLSSNENPYPPLPGVLATAQQAAQAMNRYPDMGCTLSTTRSRPSSASAPDSSPPVPVR